MVGAMREIPLLAVFYLLESVGGTQSRLMRIRDKLTRLIAMHEYGP